METILSRRKLKRNYEYEVQWKGMPLDKNEWLTRDQLEEMGFTKALNDIDIKEAAKQGLVSRPLTGPPLTTSVQAPTLPSVLLSVPFQRLDLRLTRMQPFLQRPTSPGTSRTWASRRSLATTHTCAACPAARR